MDVVLEKFINRLSVSWLELDRSFSEVLDAVLINFFFTHAHKIFLIIGGGHAIIHIIVELIIV